MFAFCKIWKKQSEVTSGQAPRLTCLWTSMWVGDRPTPTRWSLEDEREVSEDKKIRFDVSFLLASDGWWEETLIRRGESWNRSEQFLDLFRLLNYLVAKRARVLDSCGENLNIIFFIFKLILEDFYHNLAGRILNVIKKNSHLILNNILYSDCCFAVKKILWAKATINLESFWSGFVFIESCYFYCCHYRRCAITHHNLAASAQPLLLMEKEGLFGPILVN